METNAREIMAKRLGQRAAEGNLRNLQYENKLHDFSSNDYLGFARSIFLKQMIKEEQEKYPYAFLGATGSRLLSGNTRFVEKLENELADIHQSPAGLIFNSGYTANTSLFSCLPQKNDTVICDELIHASVIDGIRMSFAKRLKFRHNDLEDLESKIIRSTGLVYVAVESVYSMNGDLADLLEIARICRSHGAHLIVDEAHAFGVFGTGLVDMLEIRSAVFARVITFGKALGMHGAIILGSVLLRDYLINFARPFIFSTALPFVDLLSIRLAYQELLAHPNYRKTLQRKCSLFKDNMPPQEQLRSSINPSAIQCVFVQGNPHVLRFSQLLQTHGFDVRAIRSPAVPVGKERLRVCIHTHNSDQAIIDLCRAFHQFSKP